MRWISVRKPRDFHLLGKFRGLILLTSLLLVIVSGLFIGVRATHAAAPYCQVTYTVTNQWSGGFGATVAIQNSGTTAWSNWTLTWTFPASGQAISSGWNGTFSQSGLNVSVASLSYNGSIAAGASVSSAPGFNGAWTTSNPVPTSFAINGNACNGTTTGTTPTAGTTPTTGTTPTATATHGTTPTATPTHGTTPGTTPTTGTTPTVTPTGTTSSSGHVVNPYVGAQGFINPFWAAEVKAGATAVGGTLGTTEAKVANFSTAVWLDSIAAVNGTNGYPASLTGFLDAAETQSASSSLPIVITIVVYDLPDRDCAALASNGELQINNNGLVNYETMYIDPIAAALSQAKYKNLRISAIIEPDSLPNLVTNLNIANCSAANSSGVYVQGVQYALNKLHAISNVYNYVDIAHDGWLGWTSNFTPAVTLLSNTIKGTTAGVNSVDGFISNTANYTPVQEPLMTANQSISGNPVRSSTFYQWNTYIDEYSYDIDLKNAFIAAGFSSNLGMLIDTSRNGWGGSGRPTAASTSTDLNTFVTATKIDKRIGRGNWCNQPSGIGARPAANPMAGIAAFVWIKPPGESDGSSSLVPTGPSNPGGKGFDRMCDPTFGGDPLNNNLPTGAIANAPVSGAWFQAAFDILVGNAFPAL